MTWAHGVSWHRTAEPARMRADATPMHGKFAASGDPAVVNTFKSELERVSTRRDRGGAPACACQLSALLTQLDGTGAPCLRFAFSWPPSCLQQLSREEPAS